MADDVVFINLSVIICWKLCACSLHRLIGFWGSCLKLFHFNYTQALLYSCFFRIYPPMRWLDNCSTGQNTERVTRNFRRSILLICNRWVAFIHEEMRITECESSGNVKSDSFQVVQIMLCWSIDVAIGVSGPLFWCKQCRHYVYNNSL